jgi:DNA-directed RNA polymerase subunit F
VAFESKIPYLTLIKETLRDILVKNLGYNTNELKEAVEEQEKKFIKYLDTFKHIGDDATTTLIEKLVNTERSLREKLQHKLEKTHKRHF